MAGGILRGMPPSRRFALAATLFVPLLLAVACGDDPDIADSLVPRSPVPDGAPTEGAAAAQGTAEATATPSPPAPTATPNAEGLYIVPCGNIHAPLDKLHRLEEGCEPDNLVAVPESYAYGNQEVVEFILPDLLALLETASAAGHRIVVVSSYRSYETQRNTFQYHVDTYGLENAVRVSARPGHSEHQLGTTVDFSSAAVGFELVEAFGSTPEGRWLAERAHEYGFILSYPAGMEQVTGYVYEPWHFRWVGRETAAEAHASGLTLGQFLQR